MNLVTLGLLLLSIVLSTAAQLLLKVGMTQSRAVAGIGPGPINALMNAILSPWVIAGLVAYFASAVVWLLVLSKVDVSRAYPCVALGFALTVIAAHFLLGEPVSTWRILGVGVIMAGVTVVALT
jgi:multidrug transporter EmrE-like cation transporter